MSSAEFMDDVVSKIQCFILSRRLDELNDQANIPTMDLPIETLCVSLCDLIGYFRLPDKRWSHKTRQNWSRALKNRQNLFQEEVTSAAKVLYINIINKSINKQNGYNFFLCMCEPKTCGAHFSFSLRV